MTHFCASTSIPAFQVSPRSFHVRSFFYGGIDSLSDVASKASTASIFGELSDTMSLLYIAALLAAVLLHDAWKRSRQKHFPPGPPPDPILGHLRVFPAKNPEVTFRKWSKQYGEHR